MICCVFNQKSCLEHTNCTAFHRSWTSEISRCRYDIWNARDQIFLRTCALGVCSFCHAFRPSCHSGLNNRTKRAIFRRNGNRTKRVATPVTAIPKLSFCYISRKVLTPGGLTTPNRSINTPGKQSN